MRTLQGQCLMPGLSAVASTSPSPRVAAGAEAAATTTGPATWGRERGAKGRRKCEDGWHDVDGRAARRRRRPRRRAGVSYEGEWGGGDKVDMRDEHEEGTVLSKAEVEDWHWRGDEEDLRWKHWEG